MPKTSENIYLAWPRRYSWILGNPCQARPSCIHAIVSRDGLSPIQVLTCQQQQGWAYVVYRATVALPLFCSHHISSPGKYLYTLVKAALVWQYEPHTRMHAHTLTTKYKVQCQQQQVLVNFIQRYYPCNLFSITMHAFQSNLLSKWNMYTCISLLSEVILQ